MAFSLNIPFYAFKLQFETGGTIIKPLVDNQVIRLNQSTFQLAKDYADVFQQKVISKGNLASLLSEYINEGFIKEKLLVNFDGARDKIAFPPFQVEFDFYYKELENGYWGVIPAISREAFGKEWPEFQKALEDTVRLEFVQNKRLYNVEKLVAVLWFENVELEKSKIKLLVPSPKELEFEEQLVQDSLLVKVASKLNIEKQVAFGRKNELEQIVRAVKGKFNKNVLLIGSSGVGKTALIWEFARQLKKRRLSFDIWETTASNLVKELTIETGWQENLSRLCGELSETEDFLYIRNLLELFEVGQYSGNEVSIGEYFRTYISRGEINMISECTEAERARIEIKSPNFLNLFQIIRMEEPKEDLENIIIQKVNNIASDRNINIDEEAIIETIRLNKRFTPYSGFPGKPIRFLESLLLNTSNIGDSSSSLGRKEVIKHFSNDSGLPLFMVDPEIPMNAEEIIQDFNNQLFDQQLAVEGVVNALASVKTALSRTGKPIASFLFVGPTGVGKTELSKILAKFMFGNRNRMVRFDMSEYSDAFSVLRLIGVNYNADGLLTSAISREPFSLLLFDEIEKAHPNFYDLLLQILGEGRLTDSKGKFVNFCSTIIIMTSNIGASNALGSQISWTGGMDVAQMANHFKSAVQRHFRPELFNRIDQIIPFQPLTEIGVRKVVNREIQLLKEREGIKFRRMDLNISPEVYDYLAKRGYHKKYGARYLQRTIREELIIPLSFQLNQNDLYSQLIVNAIITKKKIKLLVDSDPLGLELYLEELDKVNHADYASELRRAIFELQEGQIFIKLISELEILEREKKLNEKLFWKNKQKTNNYANYLEIKSETKAFSGQIEEMENGISLAVMNLTNYRPEISEKLKEWEAAFFEFKVKIYMQMYLEARYCTLGLYGTHLEPIFNFYIQLFKAKDFSFTFNSIWYREQFFKEEINVKEQVLGEDGKIRIVNNKHSRSEYIAQKENEESLLNVHPPKPGDQLYGVEFDLAGRAPRLYLREEVGVHKWKMTDDMEHLYVVVLGGKNYSRPSNIHRKDFFKDNPGRVIQEGVFKDNRLKINREYERGKILDYLLAVLDQRFKKNIDLELDAETRSYVTS